MAPKTMRIPIIENMVFPVIVGNGENFDK